MPLRRKLAGSLLAFVGFVLSPLSWWNDAFVNLPLALVFAWLVSWPFGPDWQAAVFQTAVVLGYWLTNLAGFILLHKGASQLLEREGQAARPNWTRDLLVSVGYTALIVLLIKLGVLKPLEGYFGNRL